jgi:hypothetical protein
VALALHQRAHAVGHATDGRREAVGLEIAVVALRTLDLGHLGLDGHEHLGIGPQDRVGGRDLGELGGPLRRDDGGVDGGRRNLDDLDGRIRGRRARAASAAAGATARAGGRAIGAAPGGLVAGGGAARVAPADREGVGLPGAALARLHDGRLGRPAAEGGDDLTGHAVARGGRPRVELEGARSECQSDEEDHGEEQGDGGGEGSCPVGGRRHGVLLSAPPRESL